MISKLIPIELTILTVHLFLKVKMLKRGVTGIRVTMRVMVTMKMSTGLAGDSQLPLGSIITGAAPIN